MTSYDTKAFLDQIKGPDTSYAKRLTEGCLFGEWGHPFVTEQDPAAMERLLNLVPEKESHHIRSTSVRRVEDLGLDIIMIDAKGTGPFGKYYDDAMLDPSRNLAHSLRGISKGKMDPRTRVTHKELISLVTFDAGVASGGFKHASKRYMTSTEQIDVNSSEDLTLSFDPNLTVKQHISLEHFADTELNDIFMSHKVILGTKVTAYLDKRNNAIVDPEEQTTSGLFHTFVNIKG